MSITPVKKSELINIIQGLEVFNKPKLKYEQYITDAVATADIIFHILFENGENLENIFIDLGCGTGNLTVAGAILGMRVISVDIDPEAIAILKKNISRLDLDDKVVPLVSDVRNLTCSNLEKIASETFGEFSGFIVFMNPPFGVHNKGIDVQFLKKACEIGKKVYSIHLYNEKSLKFLEKKINSFGGKVIEKFNLKMYLPQTYTFHDKKRKLVDCILFTIESKNDCIKKREK